MFQASDVDQDTKSRRELNVPSKTLIFEVQLEQKQFKKAKKVEKTLAEITDACRHAGLTNLSKQWQKKTDQFRIVRKTSKNRAAIAYAAFNFGGKFGCSPSEVID